MPESFPPDTQNRKVKLLDRVRQAARFKHYSIRTEQAYVDWIKKFIIFHKKRHPATMGADEVRDFLNHLANRVNVAASTQNQAFSALLFLYREVLRQELPWIDHVDRVKRPAKLPIVLTQDEVQALLSKMSGALGLMAQLLYGCGLRLMECVQLRVKDIDFGYRQITIRDAKGGRDRRTMLPESLIDPLRRHIEKRRLSHEEDLAAGHGAAPLPGALARKYPNAPRDFGWQYVFPSRLHTGEINGSVQQYRYHIAETFLQRAVKMAVREAGIRKPATCHTLRHSFATHLLYICRIFDPFLRVQCPRLNKPLRSVARTGFLEGGLPNTESRSFDVTPVRLRIADAPDLGLQILWLWCSYLFANVLNRSMLTRQFTG